MTLVHTPYEYRPDPLIGNSIASSGWQDHFTIRRYSPNNGTDFAMTGRCNIRIEDREILLHTNQMFRKRRPLARKADKTPYTGTGAVGAISGKTSSIKSVTLSTAGQLIENIQNYNKLCTQEYISTSLEHKIYLNKTEGLSYFVGGTHPDGADQCRGFLGDNNGKRYVMHQLQLG